MKAVVFFLCGMLLSSLFGEDSSSRKLEECLSECYKVDDIALSHLLEEFSTLNEEYSRVVDAFIRESRKLNIYAGEPSLDAGPTLPPHYSVLFENPYLRISRAMTQSGEQEPFQRHPWKSLMVVIQPSQFYSQRGDGVSYEDDWAAGVYLLDPSPDLLSCKNIGPFDYRGLLFEMKVVER